MQITVASLDALRSGFSNAFKRGLAQGTSQYGRIATAVPSTTRENKYGWLKKMPNMREWLGPRLAHGLAEHGYAIENKHFELTIGVDRNDIEDDNLGVYDPLFVEMGESVNAKADMLVFDQLKNGFATACFDGQYFFDTDHPAVNAAGQTVSVANTDGGAGTPWFLLCTKRPLKPIIYQNRKAAEFVARDKPSDSNVFELREFRYGTDMRCNVGYGFWQMAWGSKQALDAAHYETARAGIMGMKGDHGRPLGLVPDLLVVPPSLEGAGRALLQSQLVNGGESNKWAGTADLLVSPWLA